MYDYLVVGLGLAGLAFCNTLEKYGKTFRVFDDDSQLASRVAGGLYNPVVLKRLKLAWKADEQLPMVAPFYNNLQEKLQLGIHHPGPILRRFSSAEEQNQWFEACDSPALRPYLSPKILRLDDALLAAPWGFGEVMGTGRIDTAVLLTAYSNYLLESGILEQRRFEYERLHLRDGHFTYGAVKAAKVVFATGFGLGENPFFDYLPLEGNKGEYLEISCPDLRADAIIKGTVFIIPKGNNRFSVGATYDWRDVTPTTTTAARKFLLHKLDSLLKKPYRVTGQSAGIRPTVPDRRPLLGQHPEISGLYALSGFGSRGVMIAPYAALKLFEHIEHRKPLEQEMDISRYVSRYSNAGPPPRDRNV